MKSAIGDTSYSDLTDELKSKASTYLSNIRDSTVTAVGELGRKALANPKAAIASGLKGGIVGTAAEELVDTAQNSAIGDVSSNPYAQALRTTTNRIAGGAIAGAPGGAVGAITGAVSGAAYDIGTNLAGIATALPELAKTTYDAYVEAPRREKALEDRLASTRISRQANIVSKNNAIDKYLASAY